MPHSIPSFVARTGLAVALSLPPFPLFAQDTPATPPAPSSPVAPTAGAASSELDALEAAAPKDFSDPVALAASQARVTTLIERNVLQTAADFRRAALLLNSADFRITRM